MRGRPRFIGADCQLAIVNRKSKIKWDHSHGKIVLIKTYKTLMKIDSTISKERYELRRDILSSGFESANDYKLN
jgi:hypothetical protein